jgi:hypothetical protein
MYATGVGLVLYGSTHTAKKVSAGGGGFFGDVFKRIKKWVEEFF